MNSASDLLGMLWILPLSLAAAISLGWWVRGLQQRQWRSSEQAGPKAYFRGLSHLLNEQQDEAIDAFIEATRHESDTSELHFALGSLFRRRGDHDRAIRVHEHLLQRADLKPSDRLRAQHELALDFLKAGLLDRAEAAMQTLLDSPRAPEARLALLNIYERARDWSQASVMAAQLDGTTAGSFRARMAHHACELAHEAWRQQRNDQAEHHLRQALGHDPKHARALIDLARLQAAGEQHEEALQTLLRCAEQQPHVLPLMAQDLAQWGLLVPQQQDKVIDVLERAQHAAPSIAITLALIQLRPEQRTTWLQRHLSRELSLQIAAETLHDVPNLPAHALEAVKQAASPLQRYRCAACGFETHRYFWQCPGCQSWDSFPALRVEEL